MKCLKSLVIEISEESEVLAVLWLEVGFQLAPLPDFHVRRVCFDFNDTGIQARHPLPPRPNSQSEKKTKSRTIQTLRPWLR